MIFLRKTSSILAGLALLASLFLGPLVPAPALAVETDNYWLCVPLATGVNPSWCPVQKNYPLPVEVGTGYSYSIASADKQIKATSGFIHTISLSALTATPTAGLLTVYDSLAESGNVVYSEWIFATDVGHTILLDVPVATGIFVGFDGTLANAQVTVSYR